MNYRLIIQYDGTEFAGWQVQARGERTVQGELERVLSLLDGRAVAVHAEAQVASLRLDREFAPERLRDAINGNTAPDLRVVEARRAADDFHARFSARGKTYVYRIFNERFSSPFLSRYTHREGRPLDIGRMRECARLFVGTRDWTAFSAAQSDVRDRVRTVTRLDVTERRSARGRGRLVEITASAEGFLRFMVRSVAGTLMAAGRGEIGEDAIECALATGDRDPAAATAPARGLTLVEVHYEEGAVSS